MSTFANSVKRTCAAVCPLYGDVPMGAPGPPGEKGPPGPPVSFTFSTSFLWGCIPLNSSEIFFALHLLQAFGVKALSGCIHCSFYFHWQSRMQTHCKGLDWTKRAEVFGRKAWNENIMIFHVSMRTNKKYQTRHLVCVEWFLAVLRLESLFHIIIHRRINSCSAISNHMDSQADKCSWSHDYIKIFHYIRLWSVYFMLWHLVPKQVMHQYRTLFSFYSFFCKVLVWGQRIPLHYFGGKKAFEKKQNISRFIVKTHKWVIIYFPVDDVVRGNLVMMVLMEKWAHRDSTEKLESQDDEENQVWKIWIWIIKLSSSGKKKKEKKRAPNALLMFTFIKFECWCCDMKHK